MIPRQPSPDNPTKLVFQVVPLDMHPWVNDEDRANLAEALSPDCVDYIRTAMANGSLPRQQPIRSAQSPARWQRFLTFCKGRAMIEYIGVEADTLSAQRMLMWTLTTVPQIWTKVEGGAMRYRVRHIYGTQEVDAVRRVANAWKHSRRILLVAHIGIVAKWELRDRGAVVDGSNAPEVIFAEPFWQLCDTVAALKCTLGQPALLPSYRIRWFCLRGTVEEEICNFVARQAAEYFARDPIFDVALISTQ